jgi:hypothetical protein
MSRIGFFDPYMGDMGVGSALVAAVKHGRRVVAAIEKEPTSKLPASACLTTSTVPLGIAHQAGQFTS